MELNQLSIPLDISHKVCTQDLMKQDWCDFVKAIECRDVELESENEKFLNMESCIKDARRLYRHGILT